MWKEGMALFGKVFDWLSNLRPRQLFLLAAVSAVAIFGIVYLVLNTFAGDRIALPGGDNTEPVEEPQVRMVSVVVATRNIEPQSMITSSMLGTKDIPENEVPGDAVTDVADVANKPAKVRIMKDEIISHNQVYRTMEQAGFVGSIPPDCRAVSIDVSDVTGVAGFAKPGDYVDVLVIETDSGTVTSRLILQNVLLLSINKSMTAHGTNASDNSASTDDEESSVNPATKAIENPALATLALRPDEVLRLVSASKIGEIYLMLRPLVPQGDYYTGAEYSIESLKGKNDREREEQEKLEKEAAEQKKEAAEEKKRLLSLKEQMIPELRQNTGASVTPENQIEIMYGDEGTDKKITATDGMNK
jgi:pilus assembly protein CpaB